ncbi:helix-turn-helix transcriptional regulator [Haloarchaeobius sp. TZWWS8]|uniref:helix-turn-helix transcriptional regulator n=1 Tax=Haloarchaeobius sp. TZWWS8 TaxID=3446121 RepID=UPI003EBFF154
MSSSLEHLEFLALSENRVAVLQALTERAASRAELRDSLGTSRATLGRVLEGLEERSWIRKERGVYRATATGKLVAADFSRLVRTVEMSSRLAGVVDHLPDDYLDFDLRLLADARIVHPTATNSTAHFDAAVRRNRTTETGHVLTQGFSSVILEAILEALEDGGEFELVFTTPALEPFLSDESVGSLLREFVSHPSGRLFWYQESVPIAVGSHDDVIAMYVVDDQGTPVALIETADSAIASWFDATYERYRSAATELRIEDVSQ